MGYQKVTKIQEFNSNNEAANPIEFEYGSTVSTNINTQINTSNYNFNLGNTHRIDGDFDGDGHIDIITNVLSNNKKLISNIHQSSGNSIFHMCFL